MILLSTLLYICQYIKYQFPIIIKTKKKMKQIIVFLSVLCLSFSVDAQESSWFEKKLTLSFNSQFGTNYTPIYGVRSTKNLAAYMMADVAHTSGFGVGLYRYDDFSSEETGKLGFVDFYWAGSLTKNLSLYAAAEYCWWDNWSDGRCWSPYAILSYQLKSWTFTAMPLYVYYDRLSEDNKQFIFKLEISKEIFQGTSVRVASWYDNMNNNKFHYAAGITQSLPANTYLSVDGILRPGGENFIAWGFGWKFTSK